MNFEDKHLNHSMSCFDLKISVREMTQALYAHMNNKTIKKLSLS
jgi:hypothetical protein